MKALWIENGQVDVRSLAEPTPGPDEALLELRVAALSTPELALPANFAGVPGVRAVATVLRAPRAELVGRRVLTVHPIPCGACRYCLRDQPWLCALPRDIYREPRSGVIARQFTWPAGQLIAVPDGVRDYDAALAYAVAAGRPLLAVARAAGRVLVTGEGPSAPVTALSIKTHETDVYLALADESRAERFKRFGLARDPGGLFPVVIAHCRAGAEVEAALRRVEPGGTLMLDRVAQPLQADLTPALQRTITISPLPTPDFDTAFSRLQLKEVCEGLSKVREEVFPLARADDAYRCAMQPDALQILVDNL